MALDLFSITESDKVVKQEYSSIFSNSGSIIDEFGSDIVFNVTPVQNCFTDLSNTFLQLDLSVVKSDDTKLVAEEVAPVNFLLYSLQGQRRS